MPGSRKDSSLMLPIVWEITMVLAEIQSHSLVRHIVVGQSKRKQPIALTTCWFLILLFICMYLFDYIIIMAFVYGTAVIVFLRWTKFQLEGENRNIVSNGCGWGARSW